jgi:glyoxylase I family protein
MQKVQGIGGVFFRAKNPEALADWYRQHLGVDPVPTSYDALPWQQEAASRCSLLSRTTPPTFPPSDNG